MREAEAAKVMEAQMSMIVMIAAMVKAPLTEPTACRKIAMNGYPVLVVKTLSTLPRQNRHAISMAKPSTPLRAIP